LKKIFLSILIFTGNLQVFSQYPPSVGMPGSTAVFTDSSIIVNWAKSCKIQRGFVDISAMHDSLVSNGNEADALGKADNSTVSLGDSGVAIVSFNPPISNGSGFDFAVFENSFDGAFLELAFVEVSSDSIHWYRFDAVSLTPTDTQITTFGLLNPTKINNLAGKYIALYGTPFDLQELSGKPFLNIDSVPYVKLIDVIGSISTSYSTFDSQGHKINDPFPTPFFTGGFDLDAVGVINEQTQNISLELLDNIVVMPNPCSNVINAIVNGCGDYELHDVTGKTLISGSFCNKFSIPVSDLEQGLYVLKVNSMGKIGFTKFLKN